MKLRLPFVHFFVEEVNNHSSSLPTPFTGVKTIRDETDTSTSGILRSRDLREVDDNKTETRTRTLLIRFTNDYLYFSFQPLVLQRRQGWTLAYPEAQLVKTVDEKREEHREPLAICVAER